MNFSVSNNNEYWSIVIPNFYRSELLKQCIDSIHKYADMPFEIIVHEDGSGDDSLNIVMEYKNKISTIILNPNINRNVGLAVSVNRCCKLATSKYILFLNNDCIMKKPCLSEMKNVLDKEYVGVITPIDHGIKNGILGSNGTKFSVVGGVGLGCIMAMRKDFFDKVGGFNENIFSGCGDTPVLYKCWEYGYFKASFDSDGCFENIGQHNSAMTKSGFDMCFPRIFLMSDFDQNCKQREIMSNKYLTNEQNKDAGLGNLNYWRHYSSSLIAPHNIFMGDNLDESLAKKHGQNKWIKDIKNDIT